MPDRDPGLAKAGLIRGPAASRLARGAALWGLLVVSLLGIGLLIYFTRTGLAIRDDSVRYVMGAENLMSGRGYSRTSGGGELYPETGFAPFLSIMLAAVGSLGLDMLVGARLLNVVLFGLSILLVAVMIYRFARSWVAAALGSVLFLFAPNVLESHAWLMTEALFVFLMLLSLWSLLQFLDTGRTGALILSGCLVGAASITRYIGLSLAPAGALAVLWLGRGSWRTRLTQAIGFAALGVAPFLVWMLRNQAVGGAGVANRQLIFHMIRPDLVRFYLFEAASWSLPDVFVVPRAIRAAIAFAVTGSGPTWYILQGWRRWRAGAAFDRGSFGGLPWVFLLNLASYVVVLVLNSVLLDAGTTEPAATRYLVPFFSMLVVFETSVYADLVLRTHRRAFRVVGLAFAGVMIALYAQRSIAVAQASTLPLGITGIRERWSQAAADIARLAGEQPIISNNPEVVYYLVGRPAYFMPIKYDPYQQQDRQDFEDQLRLAVTRLKRGSPLVIFQPPKPWEAEALERLEVVPLRVYQDVIIYGYPASGGSSRWGELSVGNGAWERVGRRGDRPVSPKMDGRRTQ